ncbi:7459_t:CDS:1, partial [Acaulospora morrowiae]
KFCHRKREEINEFLELQEKERVVNMARERNREEKIRQGQQLVQKTSSSSDTQNAISTEINPIIKITHNHKPPDYN